MGHPSPGCQGTGVTHGRVALGHRVISAPVENTCVIPESLHYVGGDFGGTAVLVPFPAQGDAAFGDIGDHRGGGWPREDTRLGGRWREARSIICGETHGDLGWLRPGATVAPAW